MTSAAADRSTATKLLSRVPEVTIFFWIIKILATTVGETAADFINQYFNLGLQNTLLLMTGLLVLTLIAQFAVRRYVPPIYWLAVVMISIVGTLITDSLVDNFGISLWVTSALFAVALAITFAIWYRSEGTLSIHSIVTFRREAFYWLAVLFTFALGTAAGDLLAEQLNLGYLVSALLFAAMIALTYGLYRIRRLDAVWAFWIAYILTRPLGASIGDYLSQSPDDGGRGLGTALTTAIFLATIALVVAYLTISKVDQIVVTPGEDLADLDQPATVS